MSLTHQEPAPPADPSSPELPASLAQPAPSAVASTPSGQTGEKARTPKWQKWDDFYVTKIADELTFVRVQTDPTLEAVVGAYYSMPARTDWTLQALEEVERQTRPRATARVHTTETELAGCIRTALHKNSSDVEGPYSDLVQRLRRYGKGIVVARPEREHPLWRLSLIHI